MLQVINRILLLALLSLCLACDSDGEFTGTLTGKGGSLARFATTSTHLYAVGESSLQVFQYLDNGALSKINSVDLEGGVETIFARAPWLYLGTKSAMLVYDISNPSNPTWVSRFGHFTGCDPVVVQDTLAYVTFRTSGCRPGSANQLEIVNIRDHANPQRVSGYTLESPYGLGIDGNLLFVCEGDNGLTVLDVTNPNNVTILTVYRGMNAYDVIPNEGVLIMTGANGIVQYDYSDYQNIYPLSTIAVE